MGIGFPKPERRIDEDLLERVRSDAVLYLWGGGAERSQSY